MSAARTRGHILRPASRPHQRLWLARRNLRLESAIFSGYLEPNSAAGAAVGVSSLRRATTNAAAPPGAGHIGWSFESDEWLIARADIAQPPAHSHTASTPPCGSRAGARLCGWRNRRRLRSRFVHGISRLPMSARRPRRTEGRSGPRAAVEKCHQRLGQKSPAGGEPATVASAPPNGLKVYSRASQLPDNRWGRIHRLTPDGPPREARAPRDRARRPELRV
jgi:hypothetical protein